MKKEPFSQPPTETLEKESSLSFLLSGFIGRTGGMDKKKLQIIAALQFQEKHKFRLGLPGCCAGGACGTGG
jgi:hypothetical protein